MLVLQSGWNIRRFPISRWCLLDAYCGRCFTFSEINSSGRVDAKWMNKAHKKTCFHFPCHLLYIRHRFTVTLPTILPLGEFCLNCVFTSASTQFLRFHLSTSTQLHDFHSYQSHLLHHCSKSNLLSPLNMATSTPNSTSLTFSEHEMKLLAYAWQCFDTEPKVR